MQHELNVTLHIAGNDALRPESWRVLNMSLVLERSPWLRLPVDSGSTTAAAVSAGTSEVLVPVGVSASGQREQATPYEEYLPIEVHSAYVAVARTALLHILLTVQASTSSGVWGYGVPQQQHPCAGAANTTLNGSVAASALRTVTFTACDAEQVTLALELSRTQPPPVAAAPHTHCLSHSDSAPPTQLPVDHSLPNQRDTRRFAVWLTATARSKEPVRNFEYANGGMYNVFLVVPTHGPFILELELDGVSTALLHGHAVCPPDRYTLDGGQCGCPAGARQVSSGVCENCPDGSTSGPGATDCTLCTQGFFKPSANSPVSECERCPDGTHCPPNTTLTTLVLDPGHWRLSKDVSTIYSCADRDEAASPIEMSRCSGGLDAYCKAKFTGPLCRVCILPSHHYVTDSGECEQCPPMSELVLAIFVSVIVLSSLVLLGYLVYWLAASQTTSISTRSSARWLIGVCLAASPAAKFKIFFAFIQVVNLMPELYAVRVPPEYYTWMKSLQWLNADIFELYPPACLGEFKYRLLLRGLTPLVCLMAVFVFGMLVAAGLAYRDTKTQYSERDSRSGSGAMRFASVRGLAVRGLLLGLPLSLLLAFCFLPSVSASLFDTFNCKKFAADEAGGQEYYLASDLSLRCSDAAFTSPKHDDAITVAVGLILVWPFGVPVLFATLLRTCRDALVNSRGTRLSRAIGFLHRDFSQSISGGS
jgi:hypothetical protein